MAIQLLSAFKLTAEYNVILAGLQHWGIDTDAFFSQFYTACEERNITSLFEVISVSVVSNRMLTAVYKTMAGQICLKVYGNRYNNAFQVSLVDLTDNQTTYLFTIQGTSDTQPPAS